MEPSAAVLGDRARPDLCPHGVTGLMCGDLGWALLSSWDPLARRGCRWAGAVPGGAEASPAERGWGRRGGRLQAAQGLGTVRPPREMWFSG